MEEINEYQSDNDKYISGSKQNINTYIYQGNYKKAFWLLILVLERLDESEKREFIDYYSKNLLNYVGEDKRYKGVKYLLK